MDLRKAAEMAATDLEELIHWHGVRDSDDKLMPAHNQTPEIKSAIESLEALRQALTQPEQEPVAWRNTETGEFCTGGFLRKDFAKWIPLYTAPLKREWQTLTGNEAKDFYEKYTNREELIYAIDEFLEEKNS